MKTFTFSTLKTVCSTAIVVALLGSTAACSTVTPSYDNQRVYRAQSNHQDNIIYKNNDHYNQGNYNYNKRYNNKNGHYKNNKGRYNNKGHYNKNKGRYNNNGRYDHNNYHYKQSGILVKVF